MNTNIHGWLLTANKLIFFSLFLLTQTSVGAYDNYTVSLIIVISLT